MLLYLVDRGQVLHILLRCMVRPHRAFAIVNRIVERLPQEQVLVNTFQLFRVDHLRVVLIVDLGLLAFANFHEMED